MRTLSTLAPGGQASGGMDLRLTPSGDIEVVDGLESVRQGVIQRLLFWSGEWFLGVADGVPYRADIFRRPTSAGLAAAVVTEQIASVDGVTGVSDVTVTIDPVTRLMSYRAGSVSTRYGTLSGIGGDIG